MEKEIDSGKLLDEAFNQTYEAFIKGSPALRESQENTLDLLSETLEHSFKFRGADYGDLMSIGTMPPLEELALALDMKSRTFLVYILNALNQYRQEGGRPCDFGLDEKFWDDENSQDALSSWFAYRDARDHLEHLSPEKYDEAGDLLKELDER